MAKTKKVEMEMTHLSRKQAESMAKLEGLGFEFKTIFKHRNRHILVKVIVDKSNKILIPRP